MPGRWWATPLHLGFLAYALARYDVFHFLGKPYLVPACYAFLRVPAPWDLALLKRAGKTVVYQSDGCYNMIRPSAWKTRIDPAICHVCQTTQGDTYGFCSNKNTVDLNTAMRKHADIRWGSVWTWISKKAWILSIIRSTRNAGGRGSRSPRRTACPAARKRPFWFTTGSAATPWGNAGTSKARRTSSTRSTRCGPRGSTFN
ncbi:MAG: hypothetical protein IPK56_11500 [Elusimicrobia bacterium]|nr:hypothetical protein [Elusimicrobiota bacterium]